MHLAAVGVDDDGVALVDPLDHAARFADGGNAERPGDDGDVALTAGVFEDQPAQAGAVVVEQVGRAHAARDEYRIVGQVGDGPAASLTAGQDAQQAVGERIEILEPLVPVGIGLAQHAGTRVVLDALDRGLGRHAAPDRLLHAPQPAAIVREHAVGFEHLAMFAGGAQLALLQQLVDGGLQLVHRGFQAGAPPPRDPWPRPR